MAVGVTALTGWTLDILALKRLASGLASMKANTAVGLTLIGLGLSTAAHPDAGPPRAPRLRVVAGAGGLAATLALLTLAEYAFGWDLHIDQLLFRDPATAEAAAPGRMAPTTAACLLLLGSALMLAMSRRHRAAVLLSSLVAFSAFVAVLGHLYGVSSLYRVTALSGMALLTALVILVTALGVLVLHPERLAMAGRTPGGVVVRRFLPVSVLGVMTLGWLRLAGQRAGLYGTELGMSIMVASLVAGLVGVIAWTAGSLRRLDSRRLAAEQALRELNLELEDRVRQRTAELAASEQRLRSSEERLRSLLDSAPDGIVIVDEASTIRLVNRQAEALFGYPRDEIVGQQVEVLVPDWVKMLDAEHRGTQSPAIRPRGADLELAASRKDGTELPVEISLSFVETEEGMLVSAAVRDIADRLRAEQERAELEAQLHRAQREEERAVMEARLHQAQRLESIGRLAGGVAHDFNNLLAAIMNYAGLVSGTIADLAALHGLAGDEACAMVAQDVEEIRRVAKRGADLTRQLLIFSRGEVVKLEVLDLNEIVRDTEKLLRRTIGEDIDLVTVLAPGLPKTRLDRGQVEQVLMNLVVNARDAMPNGGRLEIRTAEFHADESYARLHAIAPGAYVRLTVSDTGTGMAPDVAARAFEPFFTTKPQGKGTGLGLATVYGIAVQAGGDVVINSGPGIGTTIWVNFPVGDGEPARPPEPVNERFLSSKGETVLLVEDEDMVRESARRMLVRKGYTVLVAADADEALSVAGEHRGAIDLLLTDVVMPKRSGKELASEFARVNPSVKVLFMSGYSEDVIAHRGVVDEGVNLIEKPFAAESLLGKIREILDAH
jgi:hypothetical protein